MAIDSVRRSFAPDLDAPAAARRALDGFRGQPEDDVIERSGVEAPFTFVPIPYANHSAAWVLRDIPERLQARDWLKRVVE